MAASRFFLWCCLVLFGSLLLVLSCCRLSASLWMTRYTLSSYCCRHLVFDVSRTIRVVGTFPTTPAPSRVDARSVFRFPAIPLAQLLISMLLVDLYQVFSLLRLVTLCRNHEHKALVLTHRTYLKPVRKSKSAK